MTNLSNLMHRWIDCSNDFWLKWFAAMEDGADEFIDVEVSLLYLLVLKRGDQRLRNLSRGQFFDKLRVIYRVSVEGSRQVCVRQRAGNTFCKESTVSISKGDIFKVKSVDTMGTMMGNGKPYVEVWHGNGYLLESPDLLEFAIELE